MTSIHPLPNSLITHATHIIVIRIVSAHLGAWTASTSGGLQRSVDLAIVLDQVLKGKVNELASEQFHLNVRQFHSDSPRRPLTIGLWSGVPITPGTKLIAFSRDETEIQTIELLQEGICQSLIVSEGNLDDVQMALRAETEEMSPSDLLSMAASQAEAVGYVFTEYLWAKVAQPAFTESKVFDELMDFIELPEVSLVTRWALIQPIYSTVAHSDSLSPVYSRRLIITMFRLVEIVRDPTITDNIINVFLPNILGLQGGLPEKSNVEIFKGYVDERPKLEQILKNYTGNASTNTLLQWIQGS